MNYDLVAEGGGVKGTALIGAMQSIEAHGFTPSNLAGSSAGAIVAAVRAAGYTPDEMLNIMTQVDFKDFQDGSKWKIKRMIDFWNHVGIHKGDVFYDWIKDLLEAKGVRTFGDLLVNGEDDPRWRWKLKVLASDVFKKRILIFPNDAILFNIDPNELEVAWAIRASMSIPFYFRPMRLEKSYLVDGGMLSNFPVWLFDSAGTPDWPTFGLLLKENPKAEEETEDMLANMWGMKRIFRFSHALVKTMISAHDKRFVRPGDFTHRTIQIPVGDVETTDFDLTLEKKDWLRHQGKTAANAFLDDWNWERYKTWATMIRS
jgi:NTE family protein